VNLQFAHLRIDVGELHRAVIACHGAVCMLCLTFR